MVRANDLLSDTELMKKHFETSQEMLKRGMVGVEAWLTGEGLVTHGSPQARHAMLVIYEGNSENIQTIFKQSSLQAAQEGETDQPVNQVAETLRISKPPKMDRPLSLMNEKQLTAYSIDLINRQRLANGNQFRNRRKIDWGAASEKPDGHPDELVEWTDMLQSPGRMTNIEFQEIAIADVFKFSKAPHKPTKTDYFRVLIHNILSKSNVDDPESYYDRETFSSKIKKNLGRRNKTEKHLRPVPPSSQAVQIASSTPNPDINNSGVVLTPPSPRAESTILSPPTPPRPTFAPTTSTQPPEVPSFNSEVYESNGGGEGAELRRSTRPTKGLSRRSPGGNASYALCHFCKKSFYIIDTIWAKCDHGQAIHWNCYKRNPTCGI